MVSKNKNEENEDSVSFKQYDITTSANDFNIKTIFNFIESEVIEIPGFQRNYIWDMKRASKLIESFIMRLPVPQIFLYEKAKNKFLVIDGQQRLMTIYYFLKKRFPRMNMRAELRKIFSENKSIPSNILSNNEYFTDFNLDLPKLSNNEKNPLENKNYDTLDGESKSTFELTPVRVMIIKQLHPEDNDSSIYEIFNRLNTGGQNLKNQEIRSCLYRSEFYDRLNDMNNQIRWRELFGQRINAHMQDVEFILRGFAFLKNFIDYRGSLNKFLNKFSLDMQKADKAEVNYLEQLFVSFLDKTKPLRKNIFFSKKGTFNVLLFEAVFYASCKKAFEQKSLEIQPLADSIIEKIKENKKFIESTESETGKKKTVDKRFEIVTKIILGE